MEKGWDLMHLEQIDTTGHFIALHAVFHSRTRPGQGMGNASVSLRCRLITRRLSLNPRVRTQIDL